METPTVLIERERERERERVTSPAGFLHRHKLLVGLVVTIGILVYAVFNVWVYQYSKNGKAPSPASLWQTVTKSGAGFGVLKGDSTPPAKQDPAPRDTPRPTGPGSFACSPAGDCNLYGDEARKTYCTHTYADSSCLDQCGEKTKLCTK